VSLVEKSAGGGNLAVRPIPDPLDGLPPDCAVPPLGAPLADLRAALATLRVRYQAVRDRILSQGRLCPHERPSPTSCGQTGLLVVTIKIDAQKAQK